MKNSKERRGTKKNVEIGKAQFAQNIYNPHIRNTATTNTSATATTTN
jgi:hypothetical protein